MALLAGVAFTATPASAESTEQCGTDYYPSYSQVATQRHGDTFAVSYSFQLTQTQRDTLVCLEDWLEIEAPISGFDLPRSWDDYDVETNIPGAQEDVSWPDSYPAPAVTGIWTGDLQANTQYHFTLVWDSNVADDATPEVTIRWLPAHWSFTFDYHEGPACSVGHFTGNVAWCIFGADGLDVDMVRSYYSTVLPFYHGTHVYPIEPYAFPEY